MSWISSSAIQKIDPISDLYYPRAELAALGAKSIGNNCEISRKVSLHKFCGYFGDYVRIDDWCSIKGDVRFSSFIHIASFCMISGIHAPVTIREFVGFSTHISVFSGSDDYNASAPNGPWAGKHSAVRHGPIEVGACSLIGAHCVILPQVKIGDGASIGSHCTIWRDVPEGGIMRMPKSELKDERRDVATIKREAAFILEDAERMC